MDVYIAQTVSICLALPSVLLYLLECVVIVRDWRKSFNSSFFRLFLVCAFNNLALNFLPYIPVLRISELGWFVDFYERLPNWVAKLFFCLSFGTFHAENFLTVVIIAHRLSAILWPLDFEQLWRRGLPLSLVGCLLGTLALSWPLFSLNIRFNVDGKNPAFRRVHSSYVVNNPKLPFFNAYQHLFICVLVFLAVSTALNFAILAAYKWHRLKRARGRDREGERFTTTLEFRLFVYTMAMFVGQLLHCTYYIFAYLYTLYSIELKNVWDIVVDQYIWINDLRVLVFPAWFLFWASTEVSTQVRAMVKDCLVEPVKRTAIKAGEMATKWRTRIVRMMKRKLGSRRQSNGNNQLFIVQHPRRGRRWTHPLVMFPNQL